MSAPLLIALIVGVTFVGGALTGWWLRSTEPPVHPVITESDLLTALQTSNATLRGSYRAASDRARSAELDLAAAMITTAHLEIEVDRLTQTVDEANTELAAARAWVRKIWRERAISQGALGRHPSAGIEEWTAPPESAPRPIGTDWRHAVGGLLAGHDPGDTRWN